MPQDLLLSKEELQFAAICLARSISLIYFHHLQLFLFVKVEECKSIYSELSGITSTDIANY